MTYERQCPRCGSSTDKRRRDCSECGYIFSVARPLQQRHPNALAELHDAPVSERKFGHSWARILTPVENGRVQLQIMDIDTNVVDIIEGPLDMVLNIYVLRGTGLRVYKDRRK